MAVRWDIRREGRAWSAEEIPARWELTPEKFEMMDGRIFLDENDRMNMLALLLENVGVDAAVRLGRLEVWETRDLMKADTLSLHRPTLQIRCNPARGGESWRAVASAAC